MSAPTIDREFFVRMTSDELFGYLGDLINGEPGFRTPTQMKLLWKELGKRGEIEAITTYLKGR